MKKTIMSLVLMVIAVCAFPQAPDWQWVAQAGGSNGDEGYAIAIDDNGNSYVAGSFQNTATFGSYSLTSSESGDIFVAKMDANGNWLWAAQAGGSHWNVGRAIAIDDNGNSYVTGHFTDTATFGSYSLTGSGDYDIFVAKLDANGNWLWATQAGGSHWDVGRAIAVDDNGNSYVTGTFQNTATFGSYSLTSSGDRDIFVAKLDTNGNWLWITRAGGNHDDWGNAIALDDNENSYIMGSFKDIATFGDYSLSNGRYFDIFIAKLDANGNWLWATQAGGSYNDYGYAIVNDDCGNSYVTGLFYDTVTFGDYSLTSSGYFDIFVAKMDVNGNWLWATQAGGNDYDYSSGIAIDDNGNSYVTGAFFDTLTFGDYSLTNGGLGDIFVAKMDINGNWLWAARAGGSNNDFSHSIAIDNNGNSYVTGYFNDTVTFGDYSLASSGDIDIFVAKLGNNTSTENNITPTNNGLFNYPNPFNPTTVIEFSIPIESNIELSIYNIKGQKIKTLANAQYPIGNHTAIWNGDDETGESVGTGIYYYKLTVNGKTEAVKKCLLLK